MSDETEITITVGRLAAKLAEAMADGLTMGRGQVALIVAEALRAEREAVVAYLAGQGTLPHVREAIERGEHVR